MTAALMEHRADHIIRIARSRTGNREYSTTAGLQQRDFVAFLNDGQERLFNKMLQTHSTLFQKQVYLSTVSGEAAVDLPASDIYLQHNIVTAMFSYNGNPVNYAPLVLRTVREEQSVNGYPSSYFLLDDQIILSPRPSNTVDNALKITYQKVVPALDIRRGLVEAHDTTSITLSSGTSILLSETEYDLANGWVDYISVVDKDGIQLATELPVTSYSSTTKVIVTELTADQVTAITDGAAYIVFGKNASTNAWLPQVCERFLTEYTVLRAQMRDSSKESAETSPLLLAIEKDILDAVEDLEEDVHSITILDSSMLNYADELG